jgi:hypothetical protein
MTSFLTNLENFFQTTEADIVAIVIDIKNGLAVAESDINTAMKWFAAQIPGIVSGIQQVESVAQQLGVTNNAEVAAGIVAANAAVAALNAFAASENSGASNTSAVVAGFIAVKQSQAAAASAAAAAAGAPVKTPAA